VFVEPSPGLSRNASLRRRSSSGSSSSCGADGGDVTGGWVR